MSKRSSIDPSHAAFLARFVARGWIHAVREDPFEQAAVDAGLRLKLMRRELSEAHFTPKGRKVLVLS